MRNYILSCNIDERELIPMFVSRNQFENNNVIEFTAPFDIMIQRKFVVKLEI